MGTDKIPARDIPMIRLFCILFLSLLFLTGFQCNVTLADSLSDDEAAINASIKALKSENSEVRQAAAKELRRIIAKYPSGTCDIRREDGGQAYWMEKVNQILPGMTNTEVEMILPPFAETSE